MKTAEEIIKDIDEQLIIIPDSEKSDSDVLQFVLFTEEEAKEIKRLLSAPPPASEGVLIEKLIEYLNENKRLCDTYNGDKESIIYYKGQSSAYKHILVHINRLATLPTREPEAKEKFAIRFSEWLMIQCDYKNHCVWEYQGEEYTQQELIEIFKRMTPSLPTQSITN